MAAARRRRPRQARSQVTVDAILEATAQLLVSHGPRTTTNHIAERAGVSIGSLYQYFPNKEALYVALVDRHIERVAAGMSDTFRQVQATGLQDVPGLVAGIIEVEARHLPLSSALHGLAWQYPAIAERLTALRQRMTAAAGLVAAHARADLDPDALTYVLRMHFRALAGLMQTTLVEEPEAVTDPRFHAMLQAMVSASLELHDVVRDAWPDPPAE